MNKRKIREFVEDLDGLDAELDPERAHGMADEILMAAVPKKIRRAYNRVVNRAPWWAAS